MSVYLAVGEEMTNPESTAWCACPDGSSQATPRISSSSRQIRSTAGVVLVHARVPVSTLSYLLLVVVCIRRSM